MICDLNQKIEAMFGQFRVKTHYAVQAYNDVNSEYYAEYATRSNRQEDLVWYDDSYDLFTFVIVRDIVYQDAPAGGAKNRVKENINAELVIISSAELIGQIQGIKQNTKYNRDTYLFNNVFVQLLNEYREIKVERAVLDIAANERRYLTRNTISIEHRIVAIEFSFERILTFCIDLNCLFNECD